MFGHEIYGWNSLKYVIEDLRDIKVASGGLHQGSYQSDAKCLKDGCYRISCCDGQIPVYPDWLEMEIKGLQDTRISLTYDSSVHISLLNGILVALDACTHPPTSLPTF